MFCWFCITTSWGNIGYKQSILFWGWVKQHDVSVSLFSRTAPEWSMFWWQRTLPAATRWGITVLLSQIWVWNNNHNMQVTLPTTCKAVQQKSTKMLWSTQPTHWEGTDAKGLWEITLEQSHRHQHLGQIPQASEMFLWQWRDKQSDTREEGLHYHSRWQQEDYLSEAFAFVQSRWGI